MAQAVHQLDDGAWVSVNDRRVVNVSDLWRLSDHEFCSCSVADVLVEGFVEVGVDYPTVDVRFAGQCIACGAEGVSGWVPVGRIDPEDDDRFRPVANADAIISPRPTA
ncbi:hypothetical protein BRC94_11185 [Halobacteriales archaeon QS_5_70_17]|nr:MAG: hypothetical protein BRC94_11185 [Halobacteriales archaeon QS_5_70_17]